MASSSSISACSPARRFAAVSSSVWKRSHSSSRRPCSAASRRAAVSRRSSCRRAYCAAYSRSSSPLPATVSSAEVRNSSDERMRFWCCEWMSSRRVPTSRNCASDTGTSLTNARLLPAGVMMRVRVVSAAYSRSFSAKNSSSSGPARANVPSTVQLRAVSFMAEPSFLAPSSSPRAPSRIDFPAPVSPVMMFRCGSSSSSSLSISA